MRTRMIAVAGTVLGAMGVLGTVGSPAAAAEQGRDCVVNLDTKAVTCAATEEQALRAAGAAASRVIARTYDGRNYSGAVHTWVQSRACTPGYDREWQWADLRRTSGGDWNNRISSVRTYHRCDVRFYDGLDFRGAASTWIDASANLATVGGGWSNRASSIKFS
ncbi:peptidase inhibitor family I36 protein [Plantactinospora solaniradicis]|uniref:Peptidase inhibitor family I36 protein n=1 Tax=Plantactinospora solaniradicis TaxID=1723736 RepID=A0ABW1KDE8_9ACTN